MNLKNRKHNFFTLKKLALAGLFVTPLVATTTLVAAFNQSGWAHTISLQKKYVNEYDKLSVDAKKYYEQKLDDLLEIKYRTSRDFNIALTRVVVEARKLNDSFAELQKTFQAYRSLIGSQKYNSSTNKKEQDEKVFKALEAVLLDTKRPIREANSLWRPADGLLKSWYHIRELKLRANINAEKVKKSIDEIKTAQSGLNGNTEKKYKVNAAKAIAEIQTLEYLSAIAKLTFQRQLEALERNTDLSNQQLRSEETRITKTAKDLNASFDKLEKAFYDYRHLLIMGTVDYVKASNKKEQDGKVFRAVESVLMDTKRQGSQSLSISKPTDGLMTKTYNISDLKFRANVTSNDVEKAILEISKAKYDLDGMASSVLYIPNFKIESLTKQVHSYSHLSLNAKNWFVSAIRRVTGNTNTLEYKTKIFTIMLKVQRLNDSFEKLQKAYHEYRDIVKARNYPNANVFKKYDEMVFKALESVLKDEGRSGEEEKTLWRPADGLLKSWYHIRDLKFRANINVADVYLAIEKINETKKATANAYSR
ncbi:hypothetical protein ACW95P_02615 [Candidatus Mycoplasma pogonae]